MPLTRGKPTDINYRQLTNNPTLSMKKFLLALLAILACVGVQGATVSKALTGVQNPIVTYWSVDTQNKPIELTAQVYYKNKDFDFVMINCHPTITHNDGAPTGSKPQMEAVKYMVSENCLLICPDYIGFGKTSGTTHPYMCATLTARNVLDAYKAAIKYVKEQGCTFKENYYTINVGYSQGGATALAFQRFLETEGSMEDRALVNLQGSVCGAGPYDQKIVFDTYEEWCKNEDYELDYPIYLYYVLNGHKATFGETTMKDLDLKDCFTENFWNYFQNSVKAKFEEKATNVDDLNKMLKGMGFDSFYKIISADYKDHDSKVYRTIRKTLEQSNLLKEGWTPQHNIIFYHDRAGNDIVVPYACTVAALDRFKDHCSYVDAVDDYKYDAPNVNSLWHCAVFREHLPSKYGSADYLTESGLMLAAGFTGNEKYTFSKLDHRTFGARFYAQFLALQIRPTGSIGQGTALHDTNIAPVETETASTLTLPEGATEAGAYNRVTTTLPIYEADRLTFMQFSTPVDGFAFGWDAERYEVTLNNDGEAMSYRKMDYLEDFKTGEVYAISSKTPVSEVLSMTAGVQTTVQAGEQPWVKLNYRKLNSLGGKSYASAYLPFGYKAAEGADIYLVKESESEGFVTATKTEAGVSAGTGTLLISHSNAPLAVLEPDIQDEAGTEKGILTGCYSETANDPDHYLLFGKSNKGNVGFWKYTSETVRPYSAFLINSSVNEAKGVEIALSEDTDAIRLIDSKEATQGIYGIDGTKRNALQHGVNLLRNTNGSVRKVIKK